MRMQYLDVAGLDVTVSSIYGNRDDAEETRALMREAMQFMHGDERLEVIVAGWNASVEEVKKWVEEEGPGWAAIYPKENTCFTRAGGENASKIDFFVVNLIAQHLLVWTQVHAEQGAGKGLPVVKYTPLRTHKVVTSTFKIQGQIWLEKWARRKPIPTSRALSDRTGHTHL